MTVLTRFVSWFKAEDAKLMAFLQPTIAALTPVVKQFAEQDLAMIVTAIIPVLGAGGVAAETAALEIAAKAVGALALKQGLQVGTTATASIAANLVATAQQSTITKTN